MSGLKQLAESRLSAIEERLGHRFVNRQLLREALTHSSVSGRQRRAKFNNERLEFLGDRVLGLLIADLLFTGYAHEGEGALSRRHAALARRETLAEIAAELEVGGWLVLARSEEEGGGRANPALLADGLEALIGALYLDGGLSVAETFVRRLWEMRLAAMGAPPRDAKTALQEWAQGHGLALPAYRVVRTEGPPHAPSFEVAVTVADLAPETGAGGSKRAAEQAAAERLLTRVTTNTEPADGTE